MLCDLNDLCLQNKMPSVEKVNSGLWIIPSERLRTGRDEKSVTVTPNSERPRAPLAEVVLKCRIKNNVCAVVKKKIKLDVDVSGTGHQGGVERVPLWLNALRVRRHHVLLPYAL